MMRDSSSLEVFRVAEMETAKGMFVLGGLIAGFSFKRGEYLRRAWFIYVGAMAVLLLRDGLFGYDIFTNDYWRGIYKGGFTLVANLVGVMGTWMLASAWKVAGIELPGSKRAKAFVWGSALILAMMFAGPSIVINIPLLFHGNTSSLIWIFSGLGDVIMLFLIAPLLLTALALRGGLLGWPWGLLTASVITWLVFDALVALLPALNADEYTVMVTMETLRATACLFVFSAGVAQRLVMKHTSQMAKMT